MMLPSGDVDGMGELPQRVGSEVPFSAWLQDVVRVDGSVTAAVVYDVAPDLEHPEPAHDGFVDVAAGELIQVVQVPTEGHASITCELLGARLGLGDHGQRRKVEPVRLVHAQRKERKPFGCQRQRSASELDARTNVRSAQLGVLDPHVPVPSIVARLAEAEDEAAHRLAIDRSAHVQHGHFVGACEVQVCRETPGVPESTLAEAGTTLEDELSAIEEPLLVEQPEQVILRDIEKCSPVGVVASGAVEGHERLCWARHGSCLPDEALQWGDEPVDDPELRGEEAGGFRVFTEDHGRHLVWRSIRE